MLINLEKIIRILLLYSDPDLSIYTLRYFFLKLYVWQDDLAPKGVKAHVNGKQMACTAPRVPQKVKCVIAFVVPGVSSWPEH